MTDDLEQTVRLLIDRENELPEESAEYAFRLPQLRGLLFSSEEAAGIIEKISIPGIGLAKTSLRYSAFVQNLGG
jgi:hypothetical protein